MTLASLVNLVNAVLKDGEGILDGRQDSLTQSCQFRFLSTNDDVRVLNPSEFKKLPRQWRTCYPGSSWGWVDTHLQLIESATYLFNIYSRKKIIIGC